MQNLGGKQSVLWGIGKQSILGLSLQLKMDQLKYWNWWLYFSSRRVPSVLKTSFSQMLYPAWLRFFSKREGLIHSNFDKQMFVHLACIQLKVVLLVLRTVFAAGFSFLQLKLWARIPLPRIGNSPSAVFPICVPTFTNVIALHFKIKICFILQFCKW